MHLEKPQIMPLKFLFFFAPSLCLEEEKLQNIFLGQCLETIHFQGSEFLKQNYVLSEAFEAGRGSGDRL